MSAMKPDAWGVQLWPYQKLEWGEPHEPAKYTYGDKLVNLYTLATVRKWLEELSEKVIAAGTLFDMKDDLSDIGADAEGIFRAMLAAKLQEIENDP